MPAVGRELAPPPHQPGSVGIPTDPVGSTKPVVPVAAARPDREEEFEYVFEGVKKKGKRRVMTLAIGREQTMEFVYIKAGTFLMGSRFGEQEMLTEMFQKKVEIAKDYYIGMYEVTQAQYKAVTGEEPSYFKGDRLPVHRVTWVDAVKFCDALSKSSGRSVGLPTEAQWEYACRAGTTTPFHVGSKLSKDLANCKDVDEGDVPPLLAKTARTTEVGSYPANPWGVYDMHGNVMEWSRDYYAATPPSASGIDEGNWFPKENKMLRTLRGGDYANVPQISRSTIRWGFSPTAPCSAGFRVCIAVE